MKHYFPSRKRSIIIYSLFLIIILLLGAILGFATSKKSTNPHLRAENIEPEDINTDDSLSTENNSENQTIDNPNNIDQIQTENPPEENPDSIPQEAPSKTKNINFNYDITNLCFVGSVCDYVVNKTGVLTLTKETLDFGKQEHALSQGFKGIYTAQFDLELNKKYTGTASIFYTLRYGDGGSDVVCQHDTTQTYIPKENTNNWIISTQINLQKDCPPYRLVDVYYRIDGLCKSGDNKCNENYNPLPKIRIENKSSKNWFSRDFSNNLQVYDFWRYTGTGMYMFTNKFYMQLNKTLDGTVEFKYTKNNLECTHWKYASFTPNNSPLSWIIMDTKNENPEGRADDCQPIVRPSPKAEM